MTPLFSRPSTKLFSTVNTRTHLQLHPPLLLFKAHDHHPSEQYPHPCSSFILQAPSIQKKKKKMLNQSHVTCHCCFLGRFFFLFVVWRLSSKGSKHSPVHLTTPSPTHYLILSHGQKVSRKGTSTSTSTSNQGCQAYQEGCQVRTYRQTINNREGG